MVGCRDMGLVMNWWSVLGRGVWISDLRDLAMLRRKRCDLVYMEEKDSVIEVMLKVIYCLANIQRLVS